MLKLSSYKEDSFSFYEEIVSSKRNTSGKPELKQELEAIANTQSSCFKNYEAEFHSNSLMTITSTPYGTSDKANLKALYRYRSKKIQQLKNLLTRHPIHTDRILNICQNCTINEADTMDHVLGQSEFPEFSVHPKNLFPCCSVCNRKKSDNYADDDGSPLFLNLYLDDLPNSQYLHVDFGDNWLPRFWLEQPDDVPDNIFCLIESHYQQLDLLNRFSECSNEIISPLMCTIKAFGSDDGIGDKIENLCHDLEPILGYNHRKIVLTRALGMSPQFITDCYNS